MENVEIAYFSAFKGLKIFIGKNFSIYMNFEKELSSMRRRLENITQIIDPPKLSMIVVDENLDQELPEVDSLTQWDLVLKIEKPPIHSN